MPFGQFLPPDHSRGDPNTLAGYIAVHDRPAAFDGSDGLSYSVEIMTSELDDEPGLAAGAEERRWAAWLLFVRWRRIGASSPEGHLESEFLAYADTEVGARAGVGMMPLSDVKTTLDALIAERHGGAAPARRWWDVMKDESE